jgi:hypothetical protein
MTASVAEGQAQKFTIARLQYNGGGDWYANPSALPNLIQAVQQRTKIQISDTFATVSIMDENFFHFPFIYLTGHGDIHFTNQERIRLRRYLIGGGILWADDNYGLDKSFRKEIAELFPDNPLTEISTDNRIYSSVYKLPGLPKIHAHDNKPAQGFGVFFDKRLVLFYSYSSDIGDGMEDIQVHKDGPELHEIALRMGVNILAWYFNP